MRQNRIILRENEGDETGFPTWEEVFAAWHVFNAKYFGGRMTEPTFILDESFHAFGQCRSRFRYNSNTRNIISIDSISIAISRRYKFTTRQWQAVLVHEMCHQWVTEVCRVAPAKPHMGEFKRIAAVPNRDGWQVETYGGFAYDNTERGASGFSDETLRQNSGKTTYIGIMTGGRFPYFSFFCTETVAKKLEVQKGDREIQWFVTTAANASMAKKSVSFRGQGAQTWEECIQSLHMRAGGSFDMEPVDLSSASNDIQQQPTVVGVMHDYSGYWVFFTRKSAISRILIRYGGRNVDLKWFTTTNPSAAAHKKCVSQIQGWSGDTREQAISKAERSCGELNLQPYGDQDYL